MYDLQTLTLTIVGVVGRRSYGTVAREKNLEKRLRIAEVIGASGIKFWLWLWFWFFGFGFRFRFGFGSGRDDI